MPVKFYYNPFYDVTNSIASLWFMKEEINDDLIIMNADVFFSEKILDNLIANPNLAVLVSDKTRIKEGDYFFTLNEDARIIKYGKDIMVQDRSCEYVGMAKISKHFSSQFKKRLEELIDEQKYNAWWENVLYSFTDEDNELISTMDVNGNFWAEIDFLDDYDMILNYIKKEEKTKILKL